MFSRASIVGLLQALSVLSAVTATPLVRRNSSSCNTPQNRACWTDGFDITTDWEEKTPLTGHTEKYTLVLEQHESYVGPDGNIKHDAMLFNGSYPGPTITANWGDWIEVNVINKLPANGTSIHWHGVRMLNNNINDGVNGVTECPIPPGGSRTYRFLAQQYGTSWYHSHHSSQYGNGVFGPLVINGPASANYDVDLGTYPINDWYYESADRILVGLQNVDMPSAPPAADNIFFNGTNVDPNNTAKGAYSRVVLTPGLKHRLRLINPSVDFTYTFTVFGHNFTVIANDFVPLNATNTTVSSLFLGIGQRYDIVIEGKTEEEIANDGSNGNYWINATFFTSRLCGRFEGPKDFKPAAILSYDFPGATKGLPTLTGPDPEDPNCQDRLDFMPMVRRDIPDTEFSITQSNTLSVDLSNTRPDTTKVIWTVNGMALNVSWEKPILEYVKEENSSWPKEENLLEIPRDSKWSFWLIENLSAVPHPMHLHGHDFVVIGRSGPEVASDPQQGRFRFTQAIDARNLNFRNPTRRDATMLPGKGWIIVAFQNDNPGAWLFHCHIAWHASMGLSVQFLERKDEIASTLNLSTVTDNCAPWRDYVLTNPPWHPKNDSGI